MKQQMMEYFLPLLLERISDIVLTKRSGNILFTGGDSTFFLVEIQFL